MSGLEEYQLKNLVTIKYMRRQLDETPDFRSHPLQLKRHEHDWTEVDYSVLNVKLPIDPDEPPKNEAEEMTLPLGELCERIGESFPKGQWRYKWYYFELLDRDEQVQPLCWVRPELLCRYWPRPTPRDNGDTGIPPKRPYWLRAMDTTAVGSKRGWLTVTWERYRERWLEDGWLRYDSPELWTSMLDYDPSLTGESDFSEFPSDESEDGPPAHRRYASAGFPGLYWKMIPLYDARQLSNMWSAMKHELFVTSVFNFGATRHQHEKLWQRMEGRFVLPFERISRYEYLIRLREQKVLEWSKKDPRREEDGLTIEEMGWKLMNEKLASLDEEEADRISKLPRETQERLHLPNAMRQVRRIRRRLREDGLIEKRKPGRPPKEE